MDKVRFGIIGVGNMGSKHFENFMNGKIKNGVVTAIADLVPEKLERMKQMAAEIDPSAKFECYASGDELIAAKPCDAVIIAVPHYFHPVFAIKAMKAGLNALVEKPAGVYTEQVREMLGESALHPELKLCIMFNQRTNPYFKKMKALIADGELGKVTRLNWIITNWFRSQSYYDAGGWRATWKGEGGGVLYNQAPHNIDLFQWIPDMMPSSVRAFCKFGKFHDIEVEDDVTAYFEYPNGATGVFITTTGDAPGTNRFEITGTKGRLIYDGGKLFFTKNEIPSDEFIRTGPGFKKPPFTTEEIVLDDENPQHVGILNNFADSILGLCALYSPASDGIRGVELANAMLLSAWEDRSVELPIDGKHFYERLQEHIRDSKIVKKENAGGVVDLAGTY